MASVLCQTPPTQSLSSSTIYLPELTRYSLNGTICARNGSQSWKSLQQKLKCRGRISCLFSGNRKDEARKALESALGGKKSEFEKWNKEIKIREERSGGGDSGGGGWFGFGGRFGWSNDDNFWNEAQQTILTLLGILALYVIVAKGDVILAVTLNPLLYALRSTRNGFTFVTNRILGKPMPSSFNGSEIKSNEAITRLSAKDRVSKKWGSE